MAADSDGSGESLTTVVTCEGDLKDPEFPAKFELILDKLRVLLCKKEARNRLCVRKLEPWNSVRVTLAIPREAALRLRQLANEGSQQLRALGILSVQVEGDQVISLRIAGRFGQEPQEIVLRTGGSQDASDVSSQPATSDGSAVVSGLSRILAGSGPSTSSQQPVQTVTQHQQLPSTSAATTNIVEPSTSQTTDKVQFRSPNVLCPTDTQVPKVPPPAVPITTPAPGATQRNYNGPFPFASMTHAAQAIHSRENQAAASGVATSASSASSSTTTTHPFTQPPPPYPSQTPPQPVVLANKANPNSPTVAMSSPLLVNLLQNDGAAQTQNKMLPPPKSSVAKRVDDVVMVDSNSANSAFVPIASATIGPVQSTIKYSTQMVYSATTNNSAVPTPNLIPNSTNSLVQTNSLGVVRPRLPLPQQFIQQPKVPVRPLVQQQQTSVALTQQQGPSTIRQVRPQVPNQKFPVTTPPAPPTTTQFGQQFPRQNFRGQLNQFNNNNNTAVQPQQFQQNFQQFPSPPPYPRQRMETIRPNYHHPEISRFQQQQQRVPQPPTTWQPNHFHVGTADVVGPPNLTGLSSSSAQNMAPIAQPMPHLGPLNSVLENSLSNITPSLTDLSKTDLDSLLPSLDCELDTTPDIPEIPESLTSTGKRRQYLINPLTGVLEPMPSDTSGSETEEEKDTNDIFNDFNSPLNDRSNSIYSDEDTCSTTISRKFDTTDQSDSEATVKSTTSENSVKSHQRQKSGKNRDRNRDSPSSSSLKTKNKDLPTEKIKLRLKLEKSEPVSPAYKVDVSFIATQQPKRATQNVTTRPNVVPQSQSSSSQQQNVPCSTTTTPPAGEELRVPPLHISLRGRNSVVINSEKKKKHGNKLVNSADGGAIEVMKKSKKTLDGLRVKKSISTKELSSSSTVKSVGSILSQTLSKSDSSLNIKSGLIKTSETSSSSLPSTSCTFEHKHSLEVNSDVLSSSSSSKSDNNKSSVKSKTTSGGDLDDLPLNYRMREPGEIIPKSKTLAAEMKKFKKSSNKLNHLDLYREHHLLTGGHIIDDYKSSSSHNKKAKNDGDKIPPIRNPHKSEYSKLNSHFKKDKLKERLGKERILPGHVGEIRRGSDSDVVKGIKRHADSNGLSHTEKKRRLSQSEGKINATAVTESQGVNKSVKLKSSSPDRHISALSSQSSTTLVHQTVVGSTNVGTITTSLSNKTLIKSSTSGGGSSKLQKPISKLKRDKLSSFGAKTKDGTSLKAKDLNRDKTYAQNVAEKLAKQLPLPIGEIDMEAKFKKSLLESASEIPRRTADRKFENNIKPPPSDTQKLNSDVKNQLDRVTDLVQTLSDRDSSRGEINKKSSDFLERQKDSIVVVGGVDTRQKPELDIKKEEAGVSPDRKSTETDLPQSDKQSGRSPNSGGQGEDSGIESMDALSEKSPNQASQSPHSHTDIITLTDPTGTTLDMKTVKPETNLPDLLDIEEQLAKMDGLPTLNGDLSHMIKTEPFMKTETLIEKLEGTEGKKDMNENKEHINKELDECCSTLGGDIKTTDCSKVEISDLPLNAAMQESLKQGNISVTRTIESTPGDQVAKPELEISLVPKKDTKTESPIKCGENKEMDFDPLPMRRKPPLYTYSNPEKQIRDTDSPNLSDLEYNSDSNSEYAEVKSKISQKAATVTRRRKQNLDNIPMNDELDACLEAMNSAHFLTDLTQGFNKKNEIIVNKKAPKSLLEQLLIEIPTEVSEKQVSSTSPSVSEKSKSSIRTRSSSKLNSPDISESSKSEKSLKTPRHSPVIIKDTSPANSPVLCSSKTTSPKTPKVILTTTIPPIKRKRQESESSTQSNVSLDETGNNIRTKKIRKCSENAVELIKACMGVENSADSSSSSSKTINTKSTPIKERKQMDKNNKLGTTTTTGLLRKTQIVDLESSDSDEPLIEIAGKVRNKSVATRNKINSTKSNIPTPLKSVPIVKVATLSTEEKVGTRRSVRNNTAAASSIGLPVAGAPLKTRSKQQQLVTPSATVTEKGSAGSGVIAAVNIIHNEGDANNRRKTRSAVSDDVKRRRNSRDDSSQSSGMPSSCDEDEDFEDGDETEDEDTDDEDEANGGHEIGEDEFIQMSDPVY